MVFIYGGHISQQLLGNTQLCIEANIHLHIGLAAHQLSADIQNQVISRHHKIYKIDSY